MKKATIDFTGCKYMMEIYLRIEEGLELTEGYVRCWDAFWDTLRFDCPFNFITVKGMSTVNKELLPYIEPMKELMEKHKQYQLHKTFTFDYEFID